MLKFSAVLACATGIILAVAATAINWGEAGTVVYRGSWPWWQLVVMEYAAAALIFAAGFVTLRGAPRGPLLLAVVWAFMAGMGWMAASLTLWNLVSRQDRVDVSLDLGLSVMLMAIAALGLSSAVTGMRRGE